MSYRSDLSRELAAVGIGGRLRSRIVAEFDDHLACNPDAQLGDPKAIARQFADELGTTRARRAAFVSFGALALAGVLFGAAFVAAPRGMLAPASASNHISWLATFAAALTACAAQVSFVAGGLALVRALRLRRDGVIAGAEAEVIRRRATVGVGAGLVTMVAAGVLALSLRHHVPGWWVTLTIACAAVAVVGLAASLPALVAARRVRPAADGAAGDIFEDLGPWAPVPLRGHPWRLALVVAGAIVVLAALAGAVTSDPFDGVARGVLDGLACLVAFATLGRYIGLWRPVAAAAQSA